MKTDVAVERPRRGLLRLEETPPLLRVVEREARVFRRLWRSSVFSSFLNPLLFLAAMGLGLGDLVDARNQGVEGLSYLVFVTPGLMAASAMQSAAGESLWPVMAGTKWVRFYHGIVATPIEAADVHSGVVLWIALRSALYSTVFLITAALMGGVPSAWGILAIPSAVLCAAAFAAPLAAFAAGRDSDVPFAMIMRLGVVPLFLFSGTFFPVSDLPAWLERLAVLSPLWHGVELCRAATTGSIEWAPELGHAAALVACITAGVVWGRRSFTRKLAE
jgi:lipooligosaccharide transport system permease protein